MNIEILHREVVTPPPPPPYTHSVISCEWEGTRFMAELTEKGDSGTVIVDEKVWAIWNKEKREQFLHAFIEAWANRK